jgi:hypothetical protein
MAVRAFFASDPEHFDLLSLAGEPLTKPDSPIFAYLLLVLSLVGHFPQQFPRCLAQPLGKYDCY